jgi:hypothetical protein
VIEPTLSATHLAEIQFALNAIEFNEAAARLEIRQGSVNIH